jgi:tRNA1(Val) A37 N6-methylase TrmN6
VVAKGYVQTPEKIVDKMVEKLFHYQTPSDQSKILDPGCGPGDFIDGIIRWCENNNTPLPNIEGIELDQSLAEEAQKKFLQYETIKIIHDDYLLYKTNFYDYIVGNPPYVPITQISENEKKLYKTIFKTATGRFDLYLLFFEKAINSLKSNGYLVFITPEKYTYVKTATYFRTLLASKQVIEIEHLDEKTFKNLVTYPLITSIKNSVPYKETSVIERNGEQINVNLPVNGESWRPYLNGKNEKNKGLTLRDICTRISCGVATGKDEIFILKNESVSVDLQSYAYPTISGSELSKNLDLKSEYSMLIPYNLNGKLKKIEELGPLLEYLSQPNRKTKLENRTCVRKSKKKWYSFHENPPLYDIFKPKILCKDIAGEAYFWKDVEGKFVPRHSVYYLVLKDTSKIDEILEYLREDSVKDWLNNNCQRAHNNYIRLQSEVLKKLPVPEKLYPECK